MSPARNASKEGYSGDEMLRTEAHSTAARTGHIAGICNPHVPIAELDYWPEPTGFTAVPTAPSSSRDVRNAMDG